MKTALILGITGKLGRAIAFALHKEGYEIIGSYHENKPENLDGFRLYPLNIESSESVDIFIDKIKDLKIDFFTSTIAKKPIMERFQNINIERFRKEFDINFFGNIYFLQKIIPYMNFESNVLFILTEMIEYPEKY